VKGNEICHQETQGIEGSISSHVIHPSILNSILLQCIYPFPPWKSPTKTCTFFKGLIYTNFQDPVPNNEAAGWMGQLVFDTWKFFIHHCFHKFGLKQHPICWAPVAFCGE